MTVTQNPAEVALSLKAKKKELELRQQELEIQKLEFELREAKADAEKAEFSAENYRYDTEAERRREKRRKAKESADAQYNFGGQVSDVTVGHFNDWLLERRLVAPGKPVTVTVYSPGGSVFAGFTMMDAIREAQEGGVAVTVKVTGYGASMAGIIAQAADTRLIGKDSYLMLHEVSSGMFGGYKLSELSDEKELAERLTRQSMDWYARRSDGKWTVDDLMKRIKKQDWWLSAEEALEAGFVDGVY